MARFDTIDQALAGLRKQSDDNTAKVLQALQAAVTKIDKALTSAVSVLSVIFRRK